MTDSSQSAAAVELAEIRVENILAPYASVLTPGILAERIVAAVHEEIADAGLRIMTDEQIDAIHRDGFRQASHD